MWQARRNSILLLFWLEHFGGMWSKQPSKGRGRGNKADAGACTVLLDAWSVVFRNAAKGVLEWSTRWQSDRHHETKENSWKAPSMLSSEGGSPQPFTRPSTPKRTSWGSKGTWTSCALQGESSKPRQWSLVDGGASPEALSSGNPGKSSWSWEAGRQPKHQRSRTWGAACPLPESSSRFPPPT